MTECWSEGELRAYFDGELPSAELERVAAHLEKCTVCAGRYAEVAGRAGRVSSMLAELEVTSGAARMAPRPIRATTRRRWVAGAAALAAGLLIGAVLIAKRSPVTVVEVPKTAPEPARAAVDVPDVMPVKETPITPTPRVRRAAARPVRRPVRREEFVSLDDEPIDTGVVVRVALGEAQIPADVILGSDGRAHAIRLVGYESGSRMR